MLLLLIFEMRFIGMGALGIAIPFSLDVETTFRGPVVTHATDVAPFFTLLVFTLIFTLLLLFAVFTATFGRASVMIRFGVPARMILEVAIGLSCFVP